MVISVLIFCRSWTGVYRVPRGPGDDARVAAVCRPLLLHALQHHVVKVVGEVQRHGFVGQLRGLNVILADAPWIATGPI